MGKAAFHLGEVGAGTKMKLAVNSLMGRVKSAVAASFTTTMGEDKVVVAPTSSARVLRVTIYGFAGTGVTHTPSEVVTEAASDDYLTRVANRLGQTVAMHVAPARLASL